MAWIRSVHHQHHHHLPAVHYACTLALFISYTINTHTRTQNAAIAFSHGRLRIFVGSRARVLSTQPSTPIFFSFFPLPALFRICSVESRLSPVGWLLTHLRRQLCAQLRRNCAESAVVPESWRRTHNNNHKRLSARTERRLALALFSSGVVTRRRRRRPATDDASYATVQKKQ